MRKMCYGIVMMLSLMATSCVQDASEIGSDFFTGGNLDFSVIDTATVSLSTILYEELQTNNATRLLVGSHTDPKLGKIKATSFFQVSKPNSLDFPEEKLKYEYCAVLLRFEGYTYYDTTKAVSLKIHRVVEDFVLEDGYLHNNDKLQYSTAPLGEISFVPRPNKQDSIEIKLQDALGLDLYNRALSGHEIMKYNEELFEYLKGFALVATTSEDGPILGFDISPELRIYYTDNNEVPSELKYITLPRSTAAYYFNHISSDRSETKLDLESSTDRQNAKLTDNESYLQSGTGLALRVDLPYLRDFAQWEKLFVIQAVLEIYPVDDSEDKYTTLPFYLQPFVVDKRNSIMGDYETDAVLYRDIDLDRTTHYKFDITSFVRNQIAREDSNEDALVFVCPDFNNTLDRIYVSAQGQFQTRVRIYYTTVNQ